MREPLHGAGPWHLALLDFAYWGASRESVTWACNSIDVNKPINYLEMVGHCAGLRLFWAIERSDYDARISYARDSESKKAEGAIGVQETKSTRRDEL